jgi:hypothetical protein
VKKQNSYHFVVSFIGECCQQPHLWSQSTKGRTRKEAWAKLKKQIEAQGLDIGEAIAVNAPGGVWVQDTEGTVNEE